MRRGYIMNREFVDYLNTLQYEQAGNSNAIAEAQQTNPFYRKVKIEQFAAKYLANRIEDTSKRPCLIILTGHAGDGKTTILFQVLEKIGTYAEQVDKEPQGDFVTRSGKKIHYAKDFSELGKKERAAVMERALENIADQYTILVANTGPLIEAFCSTFSEHDDAESIIINKMDEISENESEIYGYPILVLNVAKIDNTDFIVEYANKISDKQNWIRCTDCPKRDKCPIYFNARLARENPQTFRFLRDFYIWEQEHGRRATIRQTSAHIAYSITGGLTCNEVLQKANKNWKSKYLLSELLFGGKEKNQIKGIQWIQESKIDTRKTQKDYELFIQKSYISLMPDSLKDIWEYIEQLRIAGNGTSRQKGMSAANKRRFLKRMMMVFGWETETDLYCDLFSPQFSTFLKIRNGELNIDKHLRKMVFDAISIIFTGEKTDSSKTIYLTMRRRGERVQNVQLRTGCIHWDQLKLNRKQIESDVIEKSKYKIVLLYKGGLTVESEVSLPMLNYFEKVSRGMIVTDVDPLLSHGIESLKAQLMAACPTEESDGNEICVLVRTDDGWNILELEFKEQMIKEC